MATKNRVPPNAVKVDANDWPGGADDARKGPDAPDTILHRLRGLSSRLDESCGQLDSLLQRFGVPAPPQRGKGAGEPSTLAELLAECEGLAEGGLARARQLSETLGS